MADLNVKVGLDRSGFQTGLAAMENAVSGFGNKITGILAGSFSFAAIGAGISRAIDQGDQLQDLANRFGVAASSIQEIGNAASLSGASVNDVASAMNKLARNAGEAVAGNDKMAAAFEKIGLSSGMLQGMSPQDLFMALSKAVSSGALGMEDFAVAQELAGRGAATLMETLRMGPESIAANGRAMGVWSDDTIAALSRASDAIKTFQNKITVGLGGIIPVLNSAIERYQDFVQAVFLAGQARFNRDLDAASRADLMEQSSAKIADVVMGRSKLEQEATQMTVRNVDERVAQYDREASAKEASANRWKRAMEDQMNLDQKEAINESRAESRRLLREAERRRDATPGSQAFERRQAEQRAQFDENARRQGEELQSAQNSFRDLQRVQASSRGLQAEINLAKKEAREAGRKARNTQRVEDALGFEQAKQRLQELIAQDLAAKGADPQFINSTARQRTRAIAGPTPRFSEPKQPQVSPPEIPDVPKFAAQEFKIAMPTNLIDNFLKTAQSTAQANADKNRQPDLSSSIDNTKAEVTKCVEKLDELIRVSNTFSL